MGSQFGFSTISTLMASVIGAFLITGFMFFYSNVQANIGHQLSRVDLVRATDDLRIFLRDSKNCRESFQPSISNETPLLKGQSKEWKAASVPAKLKQQDSRISWLKFQRPLNWDSAVYLQFKLNSGDPYILPLMAEYSAAGALVNCSSDLLEKGVELACPKK